MGYRLWHDMFELREHHEKLGVKGMKFFIFDFAQCIKEDSFKYIVAQPVFSGMHTGASFAKFIIDKKELDDFFKHIRMTFEDYAKELDQPYIEEVE